MSREVLDDFVRRLGPIVRESDFTCSLGQILLVILILASDTPAVGNSKSVRKSKAGACTVRRHIDIAAWQAASTKQKKVLLEDCVGAALAGIPDKHLDAGQKAALIAMARRALYPKRKQYAG